MKFSIIIFLIFLSNPSVLIAQQIQVLNERVLNLGLKDHILVENHLCSNPSNENHLLLSGMFVAKNDPNLYGNFAAISLDKGATWQNITKFDIAEGADPWGIITKNGVALSSVLGLEELFVFRSKDGGENWNPEPVNLGKAHDHQTLIQDTSNNIVYLVSIQSPQKEFFENNPLAHFYRRMAAKHGKGTAITATARKLAIIVYNMIEKKQAYQPQKLEQYQQKVRDQKIKQIQRTIQKLEVKEDELAFT